MSEGVLLKMNSVQILCFLHTAKSKSFTSAASELFFSQQTVSRNVKELESELDIKLFERKKNDVVLTEAGSYYYSVLSNVMLEFDDFKSETGLYYDSLRYSFLIGYSERMDSFGELNTGFRDFRKDNPDVHTTARQYENSELCENLLAGTLDVALISESQVPQHRSLEAAPVASEDIRLFGPAHIIHDKSRPSGNECWGLPLIVKFSKEYGYLEHRLRLKTFLRSMGITAQKIKPILNIQSLYAELRFTEAAAIGDHRFGLIRRIPGLDSMPLNSASQVFCVWKRDNENPLIVPFVEHMKAVYGFM